MRKNLNIQNYIIKLSLFFICTIGYGQIEIRGKVTSTYTKEPLWFGFTIKPNLKQHPMSLSDKDGNYVIEFLEPNKEYEIIISAIGYDEQTFIIKTNEGITYKDIELEPNCNWIEKAENDWNISEGKFLLFGSIVPIANTKSDIRFEKKYGIEYYDYGCSPPNYECMVMYNRKIAELMDEKYGVNWREKARFDIIGL